MFGKSGIVSLAHHKVGHTISSILAVILEPYISINKILSSALKKSGMGTH